MKNEPIFRIVVAALRSSGFVLRAYILNPRRVKWSSINLPTRLRWSEAGLGVVTLPLPYWVFRSIGKNITPTVSTRKDHKLVTSGP